MASAQEAALYEEYRQAHATLAQFHRQFFPHPDRPDQEGDPMGPEEIRKWHRLRDAVEAKRAAWTAARARD